MSRLSVVLVFALVLSLFAFSANCAEHKRGARRLRRTSSLFSSRRIPDASDLRSTRGGAGGYFDPHNHNSGVLPPLAYGFIQDDTQVLVKQVAASTELANALKAIKDSGLYAEGVGAYDPSEKDLYLYQWLSTGFISGFHVGSWLEKGSGVVNEILSMDKYKHLKKGKERDDIVAKIGDVTTAFVHLIEKLNAIKDKCFQSMYDITKEMVRGMETRCTSTVENGDKCATINADTHYWQKAGCSFAGKKGRLRHGSNTAAPLLGCISDKTDHTKAEYLIENTYAASGCIDFDTSYVLRNLLSDKYPELTFKYTIQHMYDDGIRYVELSATPAGVPQKTKPDKGDAYKPEELTWKPLLYKLFYGSGKGDGSNPTPAELAVRIGWMPMGYGFWLAGDAAKGGYYRQLDEKGKCIWVKMGLDPDMETYFTRLDSLLALPYVNGIDMASPERSCYGYNDGTHGTGAQATFNRLVDTIFAAAKKHNKRLSLHVHNGEGFVNYDHKKYMGKYALDHETELENEQYTYCPVDRKDGKWFKFQMPQKEYDDLCSNCGNSYEAINPLATTYVTDTSGKEVPRHYLTAASNCEVVTNWIAEYRTANHERMHEFDNLVRFRYGHGTHCSFATAKKMAANKIAADINFSSNMATNVLRWVLPSVESSLPSLRFNLKNLFHELKDADLDKSTIRHYIATAFAEHAFARFIAAGTKVYLGTDGSGVEHSGFYKDFYVGDAIIKALGQKTHDSVTLPTEVLAEISKEMTDAYAEQSPRRTIDHVLEDAREYTHWILGKPADQTSVPVSTGSHPETSQSQLVGAKGSSNLKTNQNGKVH